MHALKPTIDHEFIEQEAQFEDPRGAYVFCPQLSHTLAPALENVPAGQAVHGEDAPVEMERSMKWKGHFNVFLKISTTGNEYGRTQVKC